MGWRGIDAHLQAIETYNGLRGGASWEALHNFELVLRAVSTALRKLSGTDQERQAIAREEENDWEFPEPLRLVSDNCVVQAFFRLSHVYSELLRRYRR